MPAARPLGERSGYGSSFSNRLLMCATYYEDLQTANPLVFQKPRFLFNCRRLIAPHCGGGANHIPA